MPSKRVALPNISDMPPTKSKSSSYPPPLVIPPLQSHKTTLIILHGRGSIAAKFAEPLLTHPVSPSSTSTTDSPISFQAHFPQTKFVFPTASLRRAVVFNRSLTHQWFDNWSLTDPELKQHLQIQGLQGTSLFLHKLLTQEIDIVGAKNVVLMGMSQGCAASLIATFLWQGERFGGVVGMCGYLPFLNGMQSEIGEANASSETRADVESQDPFAHQEDLFERENDNVGSVETKLQSAINWLRDELDFSERASQTALTNPPFESIPVFMGHGTEDEKVPCKSGRLATEFLKDVGVDATWYEYEGLGHWYSQDMLKDVKEFIKSLEGWDSIAC